MTHERHEAILARLASAERLTVAEAIRLFGVSPATVRRDFTELAGAGLARRVRGGLRAPAPEGPGEMVPFALREVRYSREKAAIARRAAELLRPGDVVIVDGGTTTFHLAACLPAIALRIITNSVRFAAALEERRGAAGSPEIYLTGGFLYPRSGLLLGPGTLAGLRQYRARLALLSVGGIAETGISNNNEQVAEAERVMIEVADEAVILADHSKLGRHAMCHVAGLEAVGRLITDEAAASAAERARLGEAGLRVETVAAAVA